jgi:hypothetical protein
MRPRDFLRNRYGVSLLYDAVLFLVMVSLAGIVLLPALRSNIAVETSVESHREHTVDEALQTYLVSRADAFEYRFCGDLIDAAAERIGIENTSNGLYHTLSQWIVGHEQHHATYATLLAEDLGCQFHLPFMVLGIDRLNILTTDFDQQLKGETDRFFSKVFHDKYEYNLTAWWHPITGIRMGGEFYVGQHPPLTDKYVTNHRCIMPYSPAVRIGNYTIILTKYWLTHQFFSNETGFGESTIPSLGNITKVCNMYIAKQPPFDVRENATRSVQENLSALTDGFLVSGVTNVSNNTIFPGILNLTLTYGFEKIKNLTGRWFEDALNNTFGDAIKDVDRFLMGLNGTLINPVSAAILQELNTTLHTLLNNSSLSLDDAFDTCERMIKENATVLLHALLLPYIESFVRGLFDVIDTVDDLAEMLINWLFDRISLDTAEVTLTIWTVRE